MPSANSKHPFLPFPRIPRNKLLSRGSNESTTEPSTMPPPPTSILDWHLSKVLRSQKMLGRFDVVPVDLFRINTMKKIQLRDFETQRKLNLTSYDLKVGTSGLVEPVAGELFEGKWNQSLESEAQLDGKLSS